MILKTVMLTLMLIGILCLARPMPGIAGCGCTKPSPAPAMVIPKVAFQGLPLTFFHHSFEVAQSWQVTFQNGSQTKTATALVIEKRDITDPSGNTVTPQLVVTTPNLSAGPTSIHGVSGTNAFSVSADSFTMIAKPIRISEQSADYDMENYATGVGADGTLYMSIGGLDKVCKAMAFEVSIEDYPLRISDIVIINAQGYLIDALGPLTSDFFFLEPGDEEESDTVHYWRHSFEQFCADRQPGGPKETDPNDPNWLLNGNPYVDFSTLIFAVAGQINGSIPDAGRVVLPELDIQTELSDGSNDWEDEQDEQQVIGADDD